MKRLLLSSVACAALATAHAQQVLVPTVPALNPASNLSDVGSALASRLNLGVSKMGVYSLADYCAGSCTTTAQQTAAFVTIAGLINAAGGKGALWIPPGQWHFDTTLAGGQMVFPNQGTSIIGPGAGTAVVLLTGGSFAQWTTNGYGRMSGFRIFEGDNPSSGAQISLKNIHIMDISDVQLGGGCVSLELATAVGVHATNLTIAGDNSSVSCAPTSVATGPVGMLVHRSSSVATNNSENNFSNLNVRGANGRTMKNAVVLSSSDGLNLQNGHIGFASGDGMLIQPEYADDKIDNIFSIGIDYDTSAIGVHLSPYSGGTFTGFVNGLTFSSGMAQISDAEGIRIDDPAAINVNILGVNINLNGAAGINVQAGSTIAITGNTYTTNNTTNAAAPDVLIDGTSAHVSVSGGTYRAGGVYGPSYHVVVAGSADYVSIGSASYSGAAVGTGDISITSSGTHNPTPVMSSTDQTVTAWPNVSINPSNGNTTLRNRSNTVVAQIDSSGSGNVDYAFIQSNGAGTGVTYYGAGASGTNTIVTLKSVAGATFVGNSTVGVTLNGPRLTALPTSVAANTYTMLAADADITFTPTGTETVTLLAASSYSGRTLHVLSNAAFAVNSASSNVVPLAGGSAGTAILAATAGKWADLQSNGTSWVITRAN